METIEVKIQVPKELSSSIPNLSKYTYEKLILGLYLDGEISLGRAAKILKMPQDRFIQLLGKHHIPYFRSDPEDIRAELKKLI